jgi:hypothetical protein
MDGLFFSVLEELDVRLDVAGDLPEEGLDLGLLEVLWVLRVFEGGGQAAEPCGEWS